MILQPENFNLLQLKNVSFLFTVGMLTSVRWMNNKVSESEDKPIQSEICK